jgi:hypothetical protein
MNDTILVDMQLSNVTCSCVINGPVEKIDLAAWLFKLSEGEYRRCCPPDHISCGTTVTDEGKPIVINVEMIGHALMVPRYAVEIATPALCKMVSVLKHSRQMVIIIMTDSFLPEPVVVEQPKFTRVEGSRHSYAITTSELLVTRQLRGFPVTGNKWLLLWVLRGH